MALSSLQFSREQHHLAQTKHTWAYFPAHDLFAITLPTAHNLFTVYTHTHRCLANLSRSIFNDAKASEQLSGRCFQAFRQSSLRKKTEAAMVFDFSCAPFCLYGTRAKPDRFACQTAALLDSVAVLY